MDMAEDIAKNITYRVADLQDAILDKVIEVINQDKEERATDFSAHQTYNRCIAIVQTVKRMNRQGWEVVWKDAERTE